MQKDLTGVSLVLLQLSDDLSSIRHTGGPSSPQIIHMVQWSVLCFWKSTPLLLIIMGFSHFFIIADLARTKCPLTLWIASAKWIWWGWPWRIALTWFTSELILKLVYNFLRKKKASFLPPSFSPPTSQVLLWNHFWGDGSKLEKGWLVTAPFSPYFFFLLSSDHLKVSTWQMCTFQNVFSFILS